MGNRRRGFTLAELIVGVVVMIVTLGVATMSLRSTDQTARREAERVVAYIYRQIDMADRIRKDFTMTVGTSSITINWGGLHSEDTSFKASDGCSYNLQGVRYYRFNIHRFTSGATITVQDANGGKCDITIASTEGRIKISSQY